jgi:hypothetical protein
VLIRHVLGMQIGHVAGDSLRASQKQPHTNFANTQEKKM